MMCDKNGRFDESLMEIEIALQFARAERWASSGVKEPNTKRLAAKPARRSKGWSTPESAMSEQTDGEESEDESKSVVAPVVVDSKSVVAPVVVDSDASQT